MLANLKARRNTSASLQGTLEICKSKFIVGTQEEEMLAGRGKQGQEQADSLAE